LRVALVTEWFPPDVGGVASHVRDLALRLSERGHEVCVVTRRREGRGEWPFELVELEYSCFLKALCRPPGNGPLSSLLRELDPDVVHVHHAFAPIPLAFALVSSARGYPTVLTNHSAYLYDYEILLKALGYVAAPVRRALSGVDRIIAVSGTAAKFIESFAPSVPVVVIPCGVDTRRFSPEGPRRLRSALGGDAIVLYVGRLVYRKGVHYLVDSMEEVRRECGDVKLVVAGDGPMAGHLRERVRELGLSGAVVFLGRVSEEELPDVYRSADLLVMPSLYGESLGIVALEGMASQLPVVASPVGGLREVVADGVTGLLLRGLSPSAIASAVARLLSRPDLMDRMGREGRRVAEERYSWEVVLPKVERVYEEVVSER